MSTDLVARVKAVRLPRGQKAVLEAIAWFIWDSTGFTDLKTVRQIGLQAVGDYGIRAVQGHLAALKADGAITSHGRAGHPKGVRYRLNTAWLAAMMGDTNPCTACAEPLQNVLGLEPEPLQNLHPKSLTGEESDTQETERAAPASPSPPPPASRREIDAGEAKQATRNQVVPASPPAPPREPATRLPDDWQPSPEVRQMAIEAGWEDPDDLRDEIYRWEQSQPTPPVRPWNASAVRWIRLQPRFDSGRPTAAKPSGGGRWDRPWLAASLFGVEARL